MSKIILSEPDLPNGASMTSQIHFEQPNIEVAPQTLELKKEALANKYDPEAWIKLGRSYRRQQLHRDAIDSYSQGITYSPFYSLLYRHRGHAYLNISRYQEAVYDFEFACRLDTTNWDSFYHLGASLFMLGEYERAEAAYKRCLELGTADDDVIAVYDWYWMVLMRLGRREEAAKLVEPIHEGMDVGVSYPYLQRLLMYKGEIKPEELLSRQKSDVDMVTMGFGLANYYYVNGSEEKGNELVKQVLEAGKDLWWSAFGYQASLVEKKRRNL